jgi:hypothetical protein
LIKANRIQSKPFRLNPGILVDDKLTTECVVTLLTRGEKKALQKEPESSREDTALAMSIISLGEVTDRSLILANLDNLAEIDVLRISQKVKELEEEYLVDGERPDLLELLRKIPHVYEIRSEPFELNPGIPTEDGKWHKSCIVRLMTRGEAKQVQQRQSTSEADDIFLRFVIVQVGELLNPTPEQIDLLIDTDIERINEEYEALRAQHAPSSKS